MKLRSIQVQNYRSIAKTQSLPLESGLTVILGPNNEGKSNLLRALVLGMECLRSVRMQKMRFLRPKGASNFWLPREAYDWQSDFPQQLQEKQPNGQTVLSLEFQLKTSERAAFKKLCGSSINECLPLEIRVGARGVQFKVKKQGPGAKTYAAKSGEIARFVGSFFDLQYIPAVRPSKLSLDVVGSLIERELEVLAKDPEYTAALQTVENLQKPVFDRLESDVQTYLGQLLPTVKSVQIGWSIDDPYRGRLRLPQFIVDDGTATDLEAKGDGIKSLVAISLMRAAKTTGTSGGLVVAIEEPESHLHPGAVRQLAVVLQEMAREHQVIITTHSPLLVARNRMEANIIVSKSKATPASSIKAVRDSLGVQVEDNLTAAEYVILVEGPTDMDALPAIFSARSTPFADLLAKGKVVFDHMQGTGNIAYKISTLRLSVATPILLVDDDKAGRGCEKKATACDELTDKYCFRWTRPSRVETELEDLISTDCYWDEVQSAFGVVLNKANFQASQEKWSVRMQGAFTAGGKGWSSSAESNVKKAIAKCVAADPSHAIATEHETLVDNVITAIVRSVTEP